MVISGRCSGLDCRLEKRSGASGGLSGGNRHAASVEGADGLRGESRYGHRRRRRRW